MFSKLHYPKEMVDSTIHIFNQGHQEGETALHNPAVYIKLPFKDQYSANRVGTEILHWRVGAIQQMGPLAKPVIGKR